MKAKIKFLMVSVLFALSLTGFSQEYVPSKALSNYFKNLPVPANNGTKVGGALDCNMSVIQGQEYAGLIGTPCVAFSFASVYTEKGIVIPPSLGLGYLVSWGKGTGLSNGDLSWTNIASLGICVSTGWKPTSLSSIPANIGVYFIWHSIAIGGYRDVVNNIWGVSFGGNISLPKITASIFNVHCLK